MASFIITSDSTTGQTLADNETGIVGRNGSIYVAFGSAIATSGESAIIIIDGAVASATANPVRTFGGTTGNLSLTIGTTGSVISAGQASAQLNAVAITTFPDLLYFSNAGTIQAGFTAARIGTDPADATTGDIINTGTMIGGVSGLDVNVNSALLNIHNSGTIFGLQEGFNYRHELGTGTVTNTGTISSGDRAVDLIDGKLIMINTGTIEGTSQAFRSEVITAELDLENTGDIYGTFNLATADDRIVNRGGTIYDDMHLGGGNDVLNSRQGTLLGDIFAEDGNDTVFAGAGADTIDGGNGQDQIYGGSGDDSLYGGGDGDTIRGNAGDDFIDGGGRHDMLIGGKGDDTLVGGGGADIFVFRRVGNGDDQINDFQNGSDKIDLSDLGIQNFNALNNTYNALQNYAGGVVIDLSAAGGSGSVRLVGIDKSLLDGSDFIF